MVPSSRGSLRKMGRCRFFKGIFLLFQILIVLLLISLASSKGPASDNNTYPTFSEVRERFLISVKPFTVMTPADPVVASSSNLSNSELSMKDKNLLRYFIDDYIAFHKRNRQNATRRLIFTPQRTGIGDRMGCLMFAYWASVLSKRVFLVDWQYPFPLQEFLTEANGLKVFLEEGQADKESAVGKLKVLSYNKSSLDTYEEVLTSDVNTVIMASHKLPGRFSESGLARLIPSNMSPASINAMRLDRNFHRAILHHVLKLRDEIRRDQETLYQQMGLSGEPMDEKGKQLSGMKLTKQPLMQPRRPYISVHARIGIGVGENRGHRFKSISENVQVAANCLASRAVRLACLGGNSALPMYLATDTPLFRKVFEKAVQRKSKARIEVMSGNWSVQHSNKLPSNLNKKSRADDWEAMWGSYMDLVMLGHGRHILALYSSFPRLSLAIGNAETLTEIRNDLCFASHKNGK